MNDDLTVGSITVANNGDYGVVTSTGMITPLTMNTSSTLSIASHFDIDDFLDEHIMNRVTCDYKIQEQELMKLRESAPDYASEIKETLSQNVARDLVKKITFTKKHDKNADVHHFIGRVWAFTEEELRNLIEEARNV